MLSEGKIEEFAKDQADYRHSKNTDKIIDAMSKTLNCNIATIEPGNKITIKKVANNADGNILLAKHKQKFYSLAKELDDNTELEEK